MFDAFANHLWQSTVFGVVVALLVFAFRRHGAHVRYWLWFTASLKFGLPFAVLVALGGYIPWTPPSPSDQTVALSQSLTQLGEPFAGGWSSGGTATESLPAHPSSTWPAALLVVWVSGMAVIVLIRLGQWRRVRAAIRASTPWHVPGLALPRGVQARTAPGLLEPAVVGIWRPFLVIPAGIEQDLPPEQLHAVLAHEMCHVRRRDNLTAALHMVVETVFWFHPLVWWIGSRLIEERERACDEEVLRAGYAPQAYAEAIVSVCRRYVQMSLPTVSGVGGPHVRSRIVAILLARVGRPVTPAGMCALAMAAALSLTLPLSLGTLRALPGQDPSTAPPLEFEVASIRVVPPERRGIVRVACTAVDGSFVHEGGATTHYTEPVVPRGWCIAESAPLGTLITVAYDATRGQVSGVGDWRDVYYIEGKAENPGAATKDDLLQMLQSLLSDRFKLKVHHETKEVDGYALLVSDNGVKFKPTSNSEQLVGPPTATGGLMRGGGGLQLRLSGGFRLDQFASFLSGRTVAGLPVRDQTNLDGMFDISFTLNPGPPRGGPNPLVSFDPPLTQALEEQLGLKLEPRKVPVEVIVVDHVEEPSAN